MYGWATLIASDEEAARLRELVQAYHVERGLGDADEVLDVSRSSAAVLTSESFKHPSRDFNFGMESRGRKSRVGTH